MRSLSTLALGLSFASIAYSRVANAPSELQRHNAESRSEKTLWNLYGLLAKKAALATCIEDDYYQFVYNSSFGQEFCSDFLNYPENTATSVYTPVSTSYFTYTTRYDGTKTIITTVPASTQTVTASAVEKRNADAEVTLAPRTPEKLDFGSVVARFRRQVGNVTIGTVALSASFSSACGCQTYGGPTITTTTTGPPRIVTVSAFWQDTTTTSATRTAGTLTTTVVATNAVPTSDDDTEELPSSTNSGSGPAPTAPGFQCPEDNNSTVSQLVGPERYDYLVMCDTDISDDDFYGVLSYSTYSQCAAACSVANQQFDLPVCQGFSFYDAKNEAGFNCFLKSSVETTVSAIGVDSGILQSIAVGVNSSSPSGTNTEAGPFPEQTTINPSIASRSLSEILIGSTTSIDVVNPDPSLVLGTGRPVAAQAVTSYSTYVSDGSTYSSGTVWSTYVSSDGMWYYSYYTSFTQSWASATTVYASSETSTSISNSSASGTEIQTGDGGNYWSITTTNTTYYYPGGYNVTQVIANHTIDANGTEIGAATTTLYYVYSTGGAGSGGASGGNGQGGPSSVSAGIVTSAAAWTSVSSTQYIVSGGGGGGGNNGGNGGGGGGAGGSDVVQTPAPSVVTNTFGTAFGSGYVISGEVTGIGGASSTEASGAVDSTVLSGGLSPISSTVISGGTGYAFSTGGSGLIPSSGAPLTPISSTVISGGTAFVSQTGASGSIPSSAPSLTPISSTVTSGGTAFFSETGGSGEVSPSDVPFTSISSMIESGGTAGASSTGGMGFTNSRDLRSATTSTTTTFPTAGTGSVPSSGASYTSIYSTGSFSGTGSASSMAGWSNATSSGPSGSGSVPFSAPTGPRSATDSTSTPPGTGSMPFSAPSGPRSATDSTSAPWGTGSAPFSAPSGPRSATDSSSPPWGTTPAVSIGTAPSSGILPPGTAPIPTGTAPYSTGTMPGPEENEGTTFTEIVPVGTGPISYQVPPYSTGTAPPLATGSLPSSGSLPVPTGTSPASSAAPPFSAPSGPRSYTPSSSGTAPFPTGTSPFSSSTGTSPPFPSDSSPTTCVTNLLGTTTILTTVTEFGCYSNCAPAGWGAYGPGNSGNSPLTFGAPVPSRSW